MSFLNFPSTQHIKVMETGEVIGMGGVQFPKHGDMGYVQAILYVHGSTAGTEQLRAKIFHDQALTLLYATSNWSAISSIPSLGADWIGKLLFTFNREPVNKTATYWFALESTGYTRNGSAFYLGFAQDYAFGDLGQSSAIWMAPYVYRWLG